MCFYKEIFHYAVVCLDKKERRKVHCVLRFSMNNLATCPTQIRFALEYICFNIIICRSNVWTLILNFG